MTTTPPFIVRDRINGYVWFRDESGSPFTRETACSFADKRRRGGTLCQVWQMLEDFD